MNNRFFSDVLLAPQIVVPKRMSVNRLYQSHLGRLFCLFISHTDAKSCSAASESKRSGWTLATGIPRSLVGTLMLSRASKSLP